MVYDCKAKGDMNFTINITKAQKMQPVIFLNLNLNAEIFTYDQIAKNLVVKYICKDNTPTWKFY